jgi:hypothetical protein
MLCRFLDFRRNRSGTHPQHCGSFGCVVGAQWESLCTRNLDINTASNRAKPSYAVLRRLSPSHAVSMFLPTPVFLDAQLRHLTALSDALRGIPNGTAH